MTVGASPQRPGAGPLPSLTLGDVVDERLASGVRVVAVRRAQVPLVQLRLRVPLGDVRARDGTTLRLLPKMLLAGTTTRSASEMAAAIQAIGASIDAGADVDHLAVDARAPARQLPEVLRLLTEVVTSPSFRRGEVLGERERVAQEVLREAADPEAAASRALSAALFPRHPYADPLPGLTSVRRTGGAALGRFHEQHVRPAGATLVVVGDVDPEDAVGTVARVLEGWSPGAPTDAVDALPEPRAPDGRADIVVVDRPGAVQSNLRIGARCEGRHDPAYPARLLAMTVFGGNFTSRIVTNLRERNGYTYAPRAGIDEHRLASAVMVQAEVASEVTARALSELRYELARIATAAITDEELESSRRYVIGTIVMGCSTQGELADTLARLAVSDLGPTYLERLVQELAALEVEAVFEEATRTLAPVRMSTLVVGDASVVADSLASLAAVSVVGQ